MGLGGLVGWFFGRLGTRRFAWRVGCWGRRLLKGSVRRLFPGGVFLVCSARSGFGGRPCFLLPSLPPVEPGAGDLDFEDRLARSAGEAAGHEDEFFHHRAQSPCLLFVAEVEQAHGDDEVVGEGGDLVVRPVGSQAVARGVVEVEPGEDFGKEPFFFTFESVSLDEELGAGLPFIAGDEAVALEHFSSSPPAGDGVELVVVAAFGPVVEPCVAFVWAGVFGVGVGRAPCALGELGGGAFEGAGPFVVADAVVDFFGFEFV